MVRPIHAHDSINPHPERSREWWIYQLQREPNPDRTAPFKNPIRNIEEAHHVQSILKSLNDEPQPPSVFADFPDTKFEQARLVTKIKEAFKRGYVSDGETYPDSEEHEAELNQAARDLLEMILDCQKGILHITMYKEDFVYESSEIHPTFNARFIAVLKLLEESKEACLGLVGPSMLERLTMDPEGYGNTSPEKLDALRNRPTGHTMALGPNEQLRKVRAAREEAEGKEPGTQGIIE